MSDKEYVERKELLKDIEEERPVNWTDSESERQAESDFYKYRDIVMMQPTADVVEVKHGKWRLETDEEMPNPMFKLVECSVCKEKTGHTFNYCPHCGAKMDLKEGAEE